MMFPTILMLMAMLFASLTAACGFSDPEWDLGCSSYFIFKHSGHGTGCTLPYDDVSSVVCKSWHYNTTAVGQGQVCHDRVDALLISDKFGRMTSKFEACFAGFEINCTASNELRTELSFPLTECWDSVEKNQEVAGEGAGQVNFECWETDEMGRSTGKKQEVIVGGDW